MYMIPDPMLHPEKILVTGATGFVGQALLRSFPGMIPAPSLRNATAEQIQRLLDETCPDAIIHTAAIADTGICEKNPEASYTANVLLPEMIARAANSIKLVCFSSDQVYNAVEEAGPYTEDMATPGSVYALHKLEMEKRVLDIQPEAVMLRAEWMYSRHSNRYNYFLGMLNASQDVSFSSRQYRGLTWVKEAAENLPAVLRLPGGVWNYGSETDLSIYEITKAFLRELGKDIRVLDGSDKHNLWMNCEKARAFGIRFSTVEDGLKRCLEDING